ncbi:MAG: cytochrome oxidase subunit III, partial [Actinomycetota bacterium]
MADTALAHGADHGAHHTTTGLSNNKLGMWIFLGSECLLFGGLISTYMLYKGRVSTGPQPDQIYD